MNQILCFNCKQIASSDWKCDNPNCSNYRQSVMLPGTIPATPTPTPTPAPSAGLSAERRAEIRLRDDSIHEQTHDEELNQLLADRHDLLRELDRLSAQKPGDGNASPTGAKSIPLVLGHPATKEWCEAVDSHHAATDEELNELHAKWTVSEQALHAATIRISTLEASLAKAEGDSKRLDCMDKMNIRRIEACNIPGCDSIWKWFVYEGFKNQLSGLNDIRSAMDVAIATLTP